MLDLSIILVNYNTREALRRCLDSIQRERGSLNIEVIVIDNGSRDGSAEMIREHGLGVHVIEPGRNTWFTGGNNLGIAAAQGEYILILNTDTIVQPGMLQSALTYLREHPMVAAVTCQMRHLDGQLQSICAGVPTYVDLLLGYTFLGVILSRWRDRRRARLWYADWDRRTTRAVDVIPDSCLMASLSLLRQINGFDERLKLYFTEEDICIRIRTMNREIHFVSNAVLLHEEHASTSQVQRLASKVYFDDLVAFVRKYHGRLAAIALAALVVPTRMGMDLAQRWRGERKSL